MTDRLGLDDEIDFRVVNINFDFRVCSYELKLSIKNLSCKDCCVDLPFSEGHRCFLILSVKKRKLNFLKGGVWKTEGCGISRESDCDLSVGEVLD